MQSTNWKVPEKITALHAWRRYAARNFDYFFYSCISCFLLGIIGYSTPENSFFYMIAEDLVDNDLGVLIILSTLLLFLLPFMNTISMYSFGNTLGKKILGVKVLELNDMKPSFTRIIKREFLVLLKGMGLGIPVISFLTNFLSYRDLIDGQTTSWDKQMNFKIIYRTQRLLVTVVTIFLIILLYASTYLYD